MKKLLSVVLLLLVAIVAKAGNPISVKAGKPTVFNVAERCVVEVDYSKAKVSDKNLTMDEYLKSRGEDFVRDWPQDKAKALELFIVRFNKKFKKGMQVVASGDDAKYKMILHVNHLDMGNGGSTFIPMASAKAGGVILDGTLDVIDVKADKYVCRLNIDKCKGIGHVSETTRLGLCYFELATNINKLAKKEKGEVEYCGEVEHPVVKAPVVETKAENQTTQVKKTTAKSTQKTGVKRAVRKTASSTRKSPARGRKK